VRISNVTQQALARQAGKEAGPGEDEVGKDDDGDVH